MFAFLRRSIGNNPVNLQDRQSLIKTQHFSFDDRSKPNPLTPQKRFLNPLERISWHFLPAPQTFKLYTPNFTKLYQKSCYNSILTVRGLTMSFASQKMIFLYQLHSGNTFLKFVDDIHDASPTLWFNNDVSVV